MKIKIKKNRHYPFLIPIALPFWVKKNSITRRTAKFKFTESCLFDLIDEDQHDVNKLFGFSIGFHHKTSFRFGWRPILSENKIEIVGYEYHDGVRQVTMPITRININQWYGFSISYNRPSQISHYSVYDTKDNANLVNSVILEKQDYGLGYTLGIYFGGNEKAPQDIVIYKS